MAKGTTIRMWRRTIFVLVVLIAVGFGAIIFSLARLQLVEGESLQTRAVDQQLKDTSISAQRGTIYDCNMKPLAQSATVWKVVLEPAFITDKNREKIADGLAKILSMDKNEIIERSKKKTYYDELKRKVETDVKDEVLKFKADNDIGSGIRLIEDYKRYYPYGAFAASVLGFTGTDSQGLYGIEKQYDSYLTGVPGKLVTAKNAIGTDMPFQYEQKVEAQNGSSLVLTIDEVVQHFLEKNLEEGVITNKVGNRACAIVMNVKTGAILGMAVKGDFDPNNPFVVADQTEAAQIAAMPEGKEKTAALKAAQEKQWRNKSVSDTYYPGSVFKMVTGSSAMEEGVVNENSTFFCSGSIKVSDRTIHCWRSYGHGSETFVQGLCNSCNPVFVQLGERLGPDKFFKYFTAFGLTAKTGIDLPGESRSIYYTAAQLNPVELATESFGQNFSITPIQMITAAAAVANGGYMVQPHVVSQIIDADGNIVKSADTTPKRQVISTDISQRMCKILQTNATIGTAKNGYLPGYRVGGKTGTSQKMDVFQKTGTMQYIASYLGFAPADDPQVAMLVFFDEPHGDSYYGAAVAGPVFSRTMEEILPYLGVERKYTDSELAKLDVNAPDVVGKTITEAKAELAKMKLTPKVYGSGDKIVSQVPEPGKTIPQNGTVVLFTDDSGSSKTVTVPKLTGLSLSAANKKAADAGINISISGAALTNGTNPVSNSQSIAEGTKVAPGTVVTVGFIEPNQVE
ncbi:penicillin-binding transpeptidase domain-containing protein [Caproiciproducens sp. R1]|uniref:penicillin-binding transpeptidase domain-containing protein n=1 Tax=Caproiciproducens sp. R1 TaxID=3435000 RepID=UPI004033EA18